MSQTEIFVVRPKKSAKRLLDSSIKSAKLYQYSSIKSANGID